MLVRFFKHIFRWLQGIDTLSPLLDRIAPCLKLASSAPLQLPDRSPRIFLNRGGLYNPILLDQKRDRTGQRQRSLFDALSAAGEYLPWTSLPIWYRYWLAI